MKKILLSLIPLVLIGLFLLFFESKKAILSEGISSLLSGDYEKTEKALAKLQKKRRDIPISLYEGYYHLARKNFQTSDFKMQQALSELPHLASSQIVAEIFLTQAASSALDGRIDEVAPLVRMAEQSCKSHPLLPFFLTLVDYYSGHFAEAAKGLGNYQFPPLEEEKKCWLSPILTGLFNEEWRNIHYGHALCETGEFAAAKEILEKEVLVKVIGDKKIEAMGQLFLGLNYLKEGKEAGFSYKVPCLQMAILTLGSIQSKELAGLQEKKIVVNALKEELIATIPLLLSNKQLEESSFFAISLLEEWNENAVVEEISHSLGDFLIGALERKEEGLLLFCNAVKKKFNGDGFHSLLMEHCFRHFSLNLKEKDSNSLESMWELVEALSATPHCYSNRLANLAISEIYRTITLDDESLAKTKMSISFFQQVKNNPEDQLDLAKKLLFYAKLLWQREGQEEKGTHLMDMALSLSQPQEGVVFRKEIETFLTELYFLAEKANTVRRLTLLHDAFEHFQIGRTNLACPIKIANHLADGYYLLTENDYSCAQLNAELVLKLDPNNQQAFRLLGIASFHQGDYYKALCSLKKVQFPDAPATKALILSEIFANPDYIGQLAQTEFPASLQKEE